MTMSMRWSGGSELLPVSGWLSTMAMMSNCAGISSSIGRERHLQVVDHGAVLGAPDDAAVRQRDRRAQLVLDQPLEAEAAASASGSGLSCV